MTGEVWDLSLSAGGGILRTSIPVAISRTLIERGCFRATLRITDEGLLITPYVAEPRGPKKHEPAVTLPKWDAA